MPKNRINEFLELIKRDFRVYVPENDRFVEMEYGKHVSFGKAKTLHGIKDIVFPKKETLFGYDVKGNIEDKFVDERKAVVGVRVCDVRGLQGLDRYFISTVHEPFYWKARENLFIVGVTCEEATSSCFCTQFGGLDNSDIEYDVWLTRIEGEYLFEARSSRAKDIAETMKLEKAAVDKISLKQKLINKVESEMGWSKIDDKKIFESFKEKTSNSVWDELSDKCLACGKCNFICPTCHCFDVVEDVDFDGNGERVKVWDACHLWKFALVTGDHNFRGKRVARVKYRIYDKFYYPVLTYGSSACVGCGRCLDVCNVNIDLRYVLKSIAGGV